jgi:hypothetical protein
MILVAATAVALGALESWRAHQRKVEHYRLMLALAPYIAGRNHFSSADGFREYLAECRHAREYLGIAQRGRSEQWTDGDEHGWQRRIVVIADP